MILNSNSLGNKIATARKKANFSQAELAQQISISSQAVGKWERGESMPDITTLNRLANILGVDLNYFSESFHPIDVEADDKETLGNDFLPKQSSESLPGGLKKKLNWDMSKLNLTDSDFSGLNNLHEKFSSSNIQRCLFVGANMAGLLLNNNNIANCDFTDSDISNSQIQGSNIEDSVFKNCSLKEAEFSKNNISNCDFSGSDFTKTAFKSSNFMKNALTNANWNSTSFHEMQLHDIIFEGTLNGCFFENCAFYGVKFHNATLLNTFFKNNKKFKRVQFIDCTVDKITYAFLKNNLADLSGIKLLP